VTGWLGRVLPGLCGVGDAGHVALTFNDGPDPVPRVLAACHRRGLPAGPLSGHSGSMSHAASAAGGR